MFSRTARSITKLAARQNMALVNRSFFKGGLSPRFYTTQSTVTTTTEEAPLKVWNPSNLKVAIIGANGDLGRLLVQKFQPHVKSILAVTSGAEFSPNNKPKFNFSNVEYRKVDITKTTTDFDFLEGVDVVVNASGTWIERDFTFKEIFVDGTKNVSFHSSRCGVKRLIHVGAMGSFVDSRSAWQNYKYKSEDMAFAAFPDVTIVRPGIMFGENATQFNHILSRLAMCPIVPAPYTMVNVQPVWEEDVAQAITKLALFEDDSRVLETVWDLGGPNYYPVKDLIQTSLQAAGKTRPVFSMYPLTNWLWDGILGITQLLPNAKIPRDYLTMMIHEWERTQENGWIVSGHLVEETGLHYTFKDLNMEPKSLEEILPTYYGSKPKVSATEKATTL